MFALIDEESMLMAHGEPAIPPVPVGARRDTYVMSGLRARTIADAACS